MRVMQETDLRKARRNLYDDALVVYFAQEPALGCVVFCTAPEEAAEYPQIKAVLKRHCPSSITYWVGAFVRLRKRGNSLRHEALS